MRSDFAAFILTHGRAGSVITDKTLRKCGYTGPIVYVIDNEDKVAAEYYAKYKNVVMFDKQRLQRLLMKRIILMIAELLFMRVMLAFR